MDAEPNAAKSVLPDRAPQRREVALHLGADKTGLVFDRPAWIMGLIKVVGFPVQLVGNEAEGDIIASFRIDLR